MKLQFNKWNYLIFLLVLWLAQPVFADSGRFVQYDLNIPGLRNEMLSAEFWISRNEEPDKVIMSSEEISRFNRNNLRNCEVLKDLRSYSRVVAGESLREMIAKVSARPTSKRYLHGREAGDEYFVELERNLNLDGIPALVPVKYGITVKRTEMRAFPTFDRVFSEPEDFEIDRFIETALYPVEPLVILHQSTDRKWFLAQAYNYLAWIPADSVALGEKNELFDYLENPKFLVVTGKGVLTAFNPINPDISELQLDMGVRVPLAQREEIPLDIPEIWFCPSHVQLDSIIVLP